MRRYRVNQHLIVLNLYSVSINKIYFCEGFTEYKFDVKCVNTVKLTAKGHRLCRVRNI